MKSKAKRDLIRALEDMTIERDALKEELELAKYHERLDHDSINVVYAHKKQLQETLKEVIGRVWNPDEPERIQLERIYDLYYHTTGRHCPLKYDPLRDRDPSLEAIKRYRKWSEDRDRHCHTITRAALEIT